LNGRIILVFTIFTILTNSCLISVASEINPNENIHFLQKSSEQIPRFYFRVLVHGNVSSAKQFGPFGNFGIVKFNHAQFVIIRFIPIRLVVNNVKNATAIMYGIGQDLPIGSFDFDEEWILFAFVF
jgi:hypothetical protein